MAKQTCAQWNKRSPNNYYPNQFVQVCADDCGREQVTVARYVHEYDKKPTKTVSKAPNYGKSCLMGLGMFGMSGLGDMWSDFCAKIDLSKAGKYEYYEGSNYKVEYDICGRAKVLKGRAPNNFQYDTICSHPDYNKACGPAPSVVDTLVSGGNAQLDKMTPCRAAKFKFLAGLIALSKKYDFQTFDSDEALEKFLNWKPGIGITGKPYKEYLKANNYVNAFKTFLISNGPAVAAACANEPKGPSEGPDNIQDIMMQLFSGTAFGTPAGKGDSDGEGSRLLYKTALLTRAVTDSITAFAVQKGVQDAAGAAIKALPSSEQVKENAKALVGNALSSLMGNSTLKDATQKIGAPQQSLFGSFGLKGLGMDVQSGVFKAAAIGLVGYSIAKRKPLLGILAGVLTFAAFKDIFDDDMPVQSQPQQTYVPQQQALPRPVAYAQPYYRPPAPLPQQQIQVLSGMEIQEVELD